MPAQELINKYCVNPQTYQVLHSGETPPVQAILTDMENHRAEAFIDGLAYFTAIQQEITQLLKSSTPNRFFYMTAWWLGLSAFHGTPRIDNTWDFNANFPEFPLPILHLGQNFETLLKEMVTKGVDVRVLPWVLPFVTNQRIEAASGMGGVNFHTLVSVSKLRQQIGNDRVVLNLLAHTFGGVHCKLFVCGDQNSMRAYTSGLDPVENRLNPPGLSKTQTQSGLLRTFTANNKNELDTVIDYLNNNLLSNQLYDVFKSLCNNLNYVQFVQSIQQGDYGYRIDLRWVKREWNLILEDNIQDKLYVFNLKRVTEKSLDIEIYQWPEGGWHDIGVKVEGRAAGAIHDFFRDMWNEQLGRAAETFDIGIDRVISHDRNWQQLQTRQPINLPANTGRQYVQVLRTIPQMNFELNAEARGKFLVPDDFKLKFGIKGHRLKIGPRELAIPAGALAPILGAYRRTPLSFAPHGCFEFKVALKKAISEAEKYIFIADQSLYALEIMDWINARLSHNPTLKVILLFGADPADPPSNFLSEAINNHLLSTNSVIPKDQNGQPTNIVFWEWIGNAVHCKVTIIDDVWCAIGSANCMRRSLYTDIELSLSILEPSTAEKDLPVTYVQEANPANFGKLSPSFVQRFRRDLWSHYCGISLEANKRNDKNNQIFTNMLKLSIALSIWNPERWRFAVRGDASKNPLRQEISRQYLNPFPFSGNFEQKDYDQKDPDSRQNF